MLADHRVIRIQGRCGCLNEQLAGFSYSLYAVHFPILIFVVAALRTDGVLHNRLQPNAIGFALIAAAMALTYFCAGIFSKVTERKTSALRRWIGGIFSTAKANLAQR
ncbi:MAG: Peptidoglycan/LPS O-acetylase OafA/YrhL, contains acyltransferase and SGNH-hydrolase domain [Rhodospirillales bacterium]|nr:Peptidoglycan/LPS O-acetylase OafA/YrhL, contains acyltransferase and SGNH-hydrolase domain [Rhodospirillales bacterium]